MASNHFISAERARQSLADPANQSCTDERRDLGLLGESVAVRQLRSQIQRIAPYFRTALIRGEAGSGKQAVARAIHALSPGADGPFVVVDACVLADEAASGAATPARSTLAPASRLEAAEGGTLYLARAGQLSFRQQGSLIRLLGACEAHRYAPPDAGRERRDVLPTDDRKLHMRSWGARIIAASDRDLRTLAVIGQFRQDLYASLS